MNNTGKYQKQAEKLAELMKERDLLQSPLIFISHKSNDKQYGDALRDFIIGLGLKNEQLIYTSHPLHKIPLNENIYDYLRKNIYSKIYMIILWSDEYLESPSCLNEMGACWIVQCNYTNMYVPDFSFGNSKYNQCAVDTNKMGAVLNGDKHCRHSMIEFKDELCNVFGLSIKENEFVFLLDSFIEKISNIEVNDSSKKTKTKISSYHSDDSNKIQELRDKYGDSMVDMASAKVMDELLKQPATQKMINQRTTQNFLRKKKK